jgi:DNA-directed RNA polymerase subunit M/transcription elongation factor TFIIS
MLVEKRDGACRECGGVLEITDADDATMTVECTECGESYLVEPDAFGDGCMTYYVEAMTRKGEDGE